MWRVCEAKPLVKKKTKNNSVLLKIVPTPVVEVTAGKLPLSEFAYSHFSFARRN
jgi:hypothetical protein